YTDQPLTNRAIRLLFNQPSLDPGQQIKCHCKRFEIEAAPPYEALSYVWGADNPTTNISIQCNGAQVLVGTNLAAALYRLRNPDSERVIWVDALCIDQHNNDEKSNQIPLMGSVYSSAKQVIVWLGK
ncbi:HET-domain-containing protein, partial [Ophiobolus disseminans]